MTVTAADGVRDLTKAVATMEQQLRAVVDHLQRSDDQTPSPDDSQRRLDTTVENMERELRSVRDLLARQQGIIARMVRERDEAPGSAGHAGGTSATPPVREPVEPDSLERRRPPKPPSQDHEKSGSWHPWSADSDPPAPLS